jgi:hypothetical protein
VKVISPWTKQATPGCSLNTYFTIPENGVIYVDDALYGTVAGTDPNYWRINNQTGAGGPMGGSPAAVLCNPYDTASVNNAVGYPLANEVAWNYTCGAGDVFIQEENGDRVNGLDGKLTVASAGNIFVTGHLDYKDGTVREFGSMLGLIADEFVYYWRGVKSTGSNGGYANLNSNTTNLRVSGALVSVQHSVMTMNNGLQDSGQLGLGNLYITGNITQKYRGVVRRGGNGYDKVYKYDDRLLYDSPPHFLEASISQFVPRRTADVAPMYPVGR